MIHTVANKIANRFFDEKDTYPLEVYTYGIELLISTLITTTLIVAVGIITESFLECVIFQISIFAIRVYTGGYHSMTYLRCTILSVMSYVLIHFSVVWAGHIFVNPFVMASGYLVTMGCALIFAPVRNPNKELTAADCKLYKRMSLIMITLVYGICTLCLYAFSIKAATVIFPTCIVIDAAMLVSVNNK